MPRLSLPPLALAAALLAGTARAEDPDPWAHRSFIAKAGRVLRGGTPLSEAEIERLAPLDRAGVVEQLMEDPRFGDAALDFSLYFLGTKPAALWERDYDDPSPLARQYVREVFQKPQAIAAAQAASAGRGDFFVLFDDVRTRYVAPVHRPYLDDGDGDPSNDLPDPQKLAAIRQRVVDAFQRGKDLFEMDDGTLDKNAGCDGIQGDDSPIFGADPLYSAGFRGPIVEDVFFRAQIETNLDCGTETVSAESILLGLDRWRDAILKMIDVAEAYGRAGGYSVDSVDDLRTWPAAEGDPILAGTSYSTFGYWFLLPNSSTNFNRKRASAMLKTYFCDDLTPLNVVPGDGVPAPGDGHASEPGCQACHYKLDPMAGFFKNKGFFGFDFGHRQFHVFDDNAVFSGDRLTSYRASWPQTGYIRSTRDSSLNDYGENLADLSAILRKAPEVKQCLTRRMAEYVLGKDQVYDGGWLQHLTARFDPPADSASAFRDVMKTLVLSRSFTVADPRPDRCYDFYPPGAEPPVACAVAHTIRNSCAQCHQSTAARNGGLDLTKWENGTFPHLDAAGNPVPRGETFTRIADRLNTSDPRRAMPRNRDMNPAEKSRLYLWALEQAQNGGTR